MLSTQSAASSLGCGVTKPDITSFVLARLASAGTNLASTALLHQGDNEHAHAHEHFHSYTDHNPRPADPHLRARALTSMFAIGALCAGKFLGVG